MKIKDLIPKIDRYCELRILPQIADSGNKWVFFLKLKVFELGLERNIPEELSFLVDENGDVDLELLQKAGEAAFEKQPEAKFGAFKFRKEDLCDFIRVVHGQE